MNMRSSFGITFIDEAVCATAETGFIYDARTTQDGVIMWMIETLSLARQKGGTELQSTAWRQGGSAMC